MAQTEIWEKEYKNPKLLTKHDKPQKSVLKFLKYIKKQTTLNIENSNVLDLGCGTGRNSNYLASQGADAIGMDISETALRIASQRASNLGVKVKYLNHTIGRNYHIEDNFIDLILDVTSSNSLNEAERQIYLKECNRVLKKDGYMFVRALCKDGDKNAKQLIKDRPGPEHDTYKLPKIKLTERVFTKEDFIKTYSPYFEVIKLKKESGYTKFERQSYKRFFWVAYLKNSKT